MVVVGVPGQRLGHVPSVAYVLYFYEFGLFVVVLVVVVLVVVGCVVWAPGRRQEATILNRLGLLIRC